MLYVGVDAHKKRSHLAVMDGNGGLLKSVEVSSTREGFAKALGRYRRPMKAVVEACYTWEPIYDWLDELVDEVTLAHPLKVRAIADARIKTDRIDAETLAHLLRADLIPAAYVPAQETRQVKRVLRQRRFLVQVRGMLKNRISALLSRNAVKRPKLSDQFGKRGRMFLATVELPEVERRLLDEDLAMLDTLSARIAKTDSLIEELSEGDPVIGWLRSIPGIGAFFAVLLRYEIDDIERFCSPRKLAAYAGLVPSTYQSSGRCFHGRLTKQGNRHVRWAAVEAVTSAVRCSWYFRRYYQHIKYRAGTGAARVATARKLLAMVWTVWKEQRCYEPR